MIEIQLVSKEKLSVLQAISIRTFRETYNFDNTAEQLHTFFDETYSLPILQSEIESCESETYFIVLDGREAGFIKFNWGLAQTEQELKSGFEIQRIYILQEFQGQGLGKKAA